MPMHSMTRCTRMRLLSFDILRTLHVPGVHSLKPDDWLRRKEDIRAADWLLFPPAWQINILAYAWRKRLFPSLSTYHLGYDKVQMTRAFMAVCPDHVPQTLIVSSTPAGIGQVLDEMTLPFVVKAPRSSMGRGVQLLEQRAEFLRYAAATDILYVQEYLPIERDLRVVYVGDSVTTAYWRTAPPGQFHNNVARGATISFEDIPQAALELVAGVAAALGIDHAGFDVAEVGGHFYLLEFNVLFGTEALSMQSIRIGAMIHEYLHGVWSRDLRNMLACPSA